jgi:hypothetical protein
MGAGWRRHYADVLTSCGHVVLVAFGAKIGTPTGWLLSFSLVSAISFIAWTANFRRHRLIGDTPTSRAASAAQGYVELIGHAEAPAGARLLSKLTLLPCVWYRYVAHRKHGDSKWELVEAGESDEPFLLMDESGQCLIDPEHAEVITTRKQTWQKDNYRYTEHLLLAKDKLYALGEFATLGGAQAQLDVKADVSELLAEWKKDRALLLQRFDLDRDAELDQKEWELARAQAKREVAKRHREIGTDSGINLLRNPRDGRLFLLSNLSPDRLTRKYRVWALIHLSIFFTAGAAALYFLAARVS